MPRHADNHIRRHIITTNDIDDLFSTLQERLEEARQEKGVSVTEARKEIQRRTGLSRATMTHWWNGKAKEPRGAATVRVADYLNVNPLWLARGIGPKRPGGKGEKTMPVPKGVNMDEDAIATTLRVAQQLSPKALQTWLNHGQALIELTRRASPKNPYGKLKPEATSDPVKAPVKKTKRS